MAVHSRSTNQPLPQHMKPLPPAFQRLASVNESTWNQIGQLAETMNDLDRALAAYSSALKHNPYSVQTLSAIAFIYRGKDQFPKAVDYFHRCLSIDQNNGEIWGALGHCYLMMDELQKAYNAYQQALNHLPNPKEPKLWYGIGILYDRYGSYEHAEEAFTSALRIDPKFEKANEIYFRLGIIYKQQQKWDLSLQCFRYILANPPKPLSDLDIYFQIGHCYEQQKDISRAKEAYEHVLSIDPNHVKSLQQLGMLYHQSNTDFQNIEVAIQYIRRCLDIDQQDAQSWYLLGRCYMTQQKYNKAYEAYQQAVYRDGRNPIFWCAIGVLYFQISQYRDALDAYSRAIRLNPYISEVWFDLGTLYESCNNQIQDALDAYERAANLDQNNHTIRQRLHILKQVISAGGTQAQTPPPPPVIPADHSGALNGPANRATSPGAANGIPPSPTVAAAGQREPPSYQDGRMYHPPPTNMDSNQDPYRPPPIGSRAPYPPSNDSHRIPSMQTHQDQRHDRLPQNPSHMYPPGPSPNHMPHGQRQYQNNVREEHYAPQHPPHNLEQRRPSYSRPAPQPGYGRSPPFNPQEANMHQNGRPAMYHQHPPSNQMSISSMGSSAPPSPTKEQMPPQQRMPSPSRTHLPSVDQAPLPTATAGGPPKDEWEAAVGEKVIHYSKTTASNRPEDFYGGGASRANLVRTDVDEDYDNEENGQGEYNVNPDEKKRPYEGRDDSPSKRSKINHGGSQESDVNEAGRPREMSPSQSSNVNGD